MPTAPNILWILTTQWRAGALGYAGDPNARTPQLDALAAESVNYTQAVTPHPFGPFARAAMMTGILSPDNGIKDYFDPLPVTAQTIVHELADRGYATGFFGKWHLGKRDPAAALVGQAHAKTIIPREGRAGFEFWEGFESGFLLNDPILHGTRLPAPVTAKGYQSDVLCDRARDWVTDALLRSSSFVGRNPALAEDRPWFCLVSLEAPHPPYDAPAAGVTPRDPKSISLPKNVPTGGEPEARARKELAGYYAHIEATDRAIGRLLEKVKREDTIVVFTSVHGDMHGAHGLFRKGWPYDESVRVPLLVRLPGVPARRDDSVVSLVDLGRMTVDWVKRSAASGPLGIQSTAGTWINPDYARISMPSVVKLPFQCERVWRGVRTKTRKFILNADGTPWLFFDLEQDPLETKNLATEPTRWEEMAKLIAQIGR